MRSRSLSPPCSSVSPAICCFAGVPWGLNVPLWVALAVAVAIDCTVGTERRVALFPAVCALLCAAGLVWRDAELLRVLDVALLLFFLPMLALRVRGVQLARAGLSEVGVAVATTGVQTVAGVPQLVFSDIPWRELPAHGTMRAGGVAARGLVLASPALIVFAALLMSADEKFAKLIQKLFFFDVPDAVNHGIVTILIAAACAGFLRSLMFSGGMPRVPRPSFVKLPAAETSVALALVNLLFAAFVLVQFRYFFLITSPASLAQYARQGFFELVMVVALVLPMLLVLDWLVEKKSKLFRALVGTQVALVLVIAASAMRRMQLYRDAYGLTELRLYTTAFMVWLAVLLLWLVATVLTGNRHRFAIGVIATGMLAVIALHAINPDALIARTNIARARAGQRVLDARYVAHLSDDAAPVILANRDAFATQPDALQRFLTRRRTIGWRTWNVSRARAIRELKRYESNASGR